MNSSSLEMPIPRSFNPKLITKAAKAKAVFAIVGWFDRNSAETCSNWKETGTGARRVTLNSILNMQII